VELAHIDSMLLGQPPLVLRLQYGLKNLSPPEKAQLTERAMLKGRSDATPVAVKVSISQSGLAEAEAVSTLTLEIKADREGNS
jgi:hypothetical protein